MLDESAIREHAVRPRGSRRHASGLTSRGFLITTHRVADDSGPPSEADGPLSNITVLDMSALGPGPFCSMILADFGARVISVERPGPLPEWDPSQFFSRGKESIVVDIRTEAGVDAIKRLAAQSDVFLEGFRPGTMERRGLGPDVLLDLNPRLVYVRLTGYGQTGPKASMAGHDINYLAASGILGVLGDEMSGPAIPLNLVGDFAGGALPATLGTVMALMKRATTGLGQVVDAAIVDGAAMLLSAQLAENAAGLWRGPGASVLSGSAPYYTTYRCADGKWFSVGAIEDRFYQQMVGAMGLDIADLPLRDSPANWPALRDRFTEVFSTATSAQWTERFATVDGCGTAVLTLDELSSDEHLAHRRTIRHEVAGIDAAPAPRLSRFDPSPGPKVSAVGVDTHRVLTEFGFTDAEVELIVTRQAAARAPATSTEV